MQQAAKEIGRRGVVQYMYLCCSMIGQTSFASLDLILSSVGGDVPQSTVDSASAFLFKLFQSDPEWSRHHGEEIRKTLGPFPASEATKACTAVKRILSFLPEKKRLERTEGEGDKPRKEFGLSIVFKSDAEEARSVSSEHDSLSDSDDLKPDAFTNVFLQGLESVNAAEDEPKRKPSKPPSSEECSQAPAVTVHSGAWLRAECQKCAEELGGMSSQELFRAVFDLLSSAEDSLVIQNEVSHGDSWPSLLDTHIRAHPLVTWWVSLFAAG